MTEQSWRVVLGEDELLEPHACRAHDKSLLVADTGNSRVIALDVGETPASIKPLLTGSGKEDDDDMLRPFDMSIDNGRTIIVDTGRSRVIELEGTSPYTVYQPGGKRGRSSPEGVKYGRSAKLHDGHIWLVDSWSHRIIRFPLPEVQGTGAGREPAAQEVTHKQVVTLAGGGMQGAELTDMNFPTDIVVAPEGDSAPSGKTVFYVSDSLNNRVLRCVEDEEPTILCGTGKPGNDAESLDNPACICVHGGFLYVADKENARVQRFDIGAKPAIGTTVAGLKGELVHPWGIEVLGDELFVTDVMTHRLLAYTLMSDL